MCHANLRFILYASVLIVYAAKEAFQDLEHFLIDNGHRYVDIICNTSSTHAYWVTFRPAPLAIARLNINDAHMSNNGAFGIFIFEEERDDLLKVLFLIAQRKVKMSLLLFTKPSYIGESELRKQLKILNFVGFLYIGKISASGITSWWHIISLKTGNVMDRLNFANNTSRIVESNNLQGLKIRSTTLSWKPFLTLDNCNSIGLECKTNHGYLKDYMDMLAMKFNFTYISHRNVDNDWGVVPKKGPHSINGTWGGVMGGVINKDYDMSISTWYWTHERVQLAQFVPIVRGRMILVSSRQIPKTDFTLLTRGFSNSSWIGIFLVLLLLLICVSISSQFCHKRHTQPIKIILFSMTLMFVMLRAYYSAALTKFFTVTIPEPFETQRDVIRAFPSWDFKIRKGDEVNILTHVLQGDEDYIAFWERYMTDPKETTYSSDKEAVQQITNGRNVILSDENQFMGYLRSNPIEDKLHIFGHGRWKYNALMFHLNSPLVPIFKQGVDQYREKGIESELYLKWIGAGYNDDGLTTLVTTVLTPGQVVLAFAFIILLYMLALIILVGELLAKKFVQSGTTGRRSTTNIYNFRRASI